MAEPTLAARTAATYDRIASTYAVQNTQAPADVARLRKVIAGQLTGSARLLDVGCGPGRDLAWFSEAGLQAVGIDRSSVMLRLAEPAVVAQADLGALPFPDGTFDVVWSAASLLHVPFADVDEVLAEWRRVLRVGGTLAVITTVGYDEGLEIVPYVDRATDASGRWFANHDESRLLATLAAVGFEVQSTSGRPGRHRWISILGEARPSRTRWRRRTRRNSIAPVIRAERPEDAEAIAEVVAAAFGSPAEARLVEAIRASVDYVPELSLVAEVEGRVVGHVMVSGARLVDGDTEHRIANLSPLAVAPAHQRQGIGSALVRAVTERADARGEPLVVLEGSPAYYSRFGFEHSVPHGIEIALPSWAPPEAAQVLRLRAYEPALRGRVVYPPAFDEVTEH